MKRCKAGEVRGVRRRGMPGGGDSDVAPRLFGGADRDGRIAGRSKRRRRGFVLLLTLALIAVAALMLAGVARQSLLAALESIALEEQLQRRWGTYSCQQTLLPRAEAILTEMARVPTEGDERPDAAGRRDDAESQELFPQPARVSAVVRLGELSFDLLLADEAAKVNLNTVSQARKNQEEIVRVIRELSADQSTLQPSLRPSAAATAATAATSKAAAALAVGRFDSWGQVFALGDATRRPAAIELRDGTHELTCWGGGQLNVRRASDEACEQICRLVTGSRMAKLFLEKREAAPNARVSDLVRSLALPQNEQQQLEQLLVDRSQCYSLWIQASSPERATFVFCLGQQGRDGNLRTTTFQW